ncbi:hypothetical protein PF006_g8893 [Phytophthora fragariae]|uniref:Uncharacterized protein n=3 Tax=Phytophthora fragariae TaxID=53985 RepID=A0A6A3U5A9_9STRA|nr:hypothetical protein PF011_g8953 [Phytophthora fragariae]KAE9146344.1 hypothetical protein PF006_g8893 [Phytophthora fragariae]
MPRATKKSGKTSGKDTNVRPRATSKSKPSQASSEDTHHSKRKRGQDEDEVDGESAKNKTASGDKFQLSSSLFYVFAHRYRAARNAHKDVDYQRLSETDNFKSFKGHVEELWAKEPELKVLLKKALAEQREIDAGKPMKNIEALEKEIAMLDVQHKEDVAKYKQLEDDIEQQEEQHSLTISKLKESYEVEIGKL